MEASVLWFIIKLNVISKYTLYLYMIPVKSKIFCWRFWSPSVIGGISNNPGDNVAHFYHLGGMIFGIILLKYWKKKGDIYY